MAQVFLPCESQQWPKDKEYFRLLSKVQSAEELEALINDNRPQSTPGDEDIVSTPQRLACLQGLSYFFRIIATEGEREVFFDKTLPFVCRSASCLDVLVPDQGVPFLQQQEEASVILGRKLVLSLIANAFLCTFPSEHPLGKKAKPFSFEKFFKIFVSGDKDRISSQSAKLRCFLNYFYRMSFREEDGVPGTIFFKRQAIAKDDIPTEVDWTGCSYPLCSVTVDNEKNIEDAGSRTLQVDFAAPHVGGGVLGGGRVQEEIRFTICPELLVSMLINDRMDDNEAIIITGYERFCYYDGYAKSFKYAGNYEDPSERDVYGNLNTALTAINAIPYGESNGEEQYREENVLRDLNKALAGFLCRDERGDLLLHNIPIRQGEYGIEEDSMGMMYETSSVMTEDDPEDGDDLDSFYVSMSSDIINQVLRPDNKAEESPSTTAPTTDDTEMIRTVANSLVSSVVTDVLKTIEKPSGKEPSVISDLAANTTNSILSSVLADTKDNSTPAQGGAVSDGQSSSSGSTQQPVNFISSIVSDAISKGVDQFLQSDSNTTQQPSLPVPVLQVNVEDVEKGSTPPPPPSSSTTTTNDYADKLVSNVLGSVLPVSPAKKSVVGLSSAGGGSKKSSPSGGQWGKPIKTKTSHTRQQSGGVRSKFPPTRPHDSIDFMDPRSLNPPSSRMSIAWSTTSTRGEDSLPSSPTELDHLAIRMVNSVDDLASVMADLIIRDAIQACSLPQDISNHLSVAQYEQDSLVSTSKGMSKIDTFLQSLHEADSKASLDLSLCTGLTPYSSSLHGIRKDILRPVATGNWGCGAFKGDPQLKSMLQWMAVSASGRPEMKYFSFNEKRLEQLTDATEKLVSRDTSVGQLYQLVLKYCKTRGKSSKKNKDNKDLFTFLLDN